MQRQFGWIKFQNFSLKLQSFFVLNTLDLSRLISLWFFFFDIFDSKLFNNLRDKVLSISYIRFVTFQFIRTRSFQSNVPLAFLEKLNQFVCEFKFRTSRVRIKVLLGSNPLLLQQIIIDLHNIFLSKNHNSLHYFLGLEITHSSCTFIYQKNDIKSLLHKCSDPFAVRSVQY